MGQLHQLTGWWLNSPEICAKASALLQRLCKHLILSNIVVADRASGKPHRFHKMFSGDFWDRVLVLFDFLEEWTKSKVPAVFFLSQGQKGTKERHLGITDDSIDLKKMQGLNTYTQNWGLLKWQRRQFLRHKCRVETYCTNNFIMLLLFNWKLSNRTGEQHKWYLM